MNGLIEVLAAIGVIVVIVKLHHHFSEKNYRAVCEDMRKHVIRRESAKVEE